MRRRLWEEGEGGGMGVEESKERVKEEGECEDE